MTDDKKPNEQKNTISNSNIQGVVNLGNMSDVDIKMSDLTQTISSLPTAADDEKAQLAALVQQLEAALRALPADQQKDAEKIAKRSQELVDEVKADELEPEIIQAKAAALQNAAKNIAGVMPLVGSIVAAIFQIAKINIGR